MAANFVRAYPGTLGSCVLAADRDDADPDPWTIDRLVWPVLAVTRRAGGRPRAGCSPPTAAGRVPATHRPAGWPTCSTATTCTDRRWSDRGRPARTSTGSGRRVSDAASWQPHLWRLVRDGSASPARPSGWPGLLERVAEGDLVLDLPPRLVFFGFTLLPGAGSSTWRGRWPGTGTSTSSCSSRPVSTPATCVGPAPIHPTADRGSAPTTPRPLMVDSPSCARGVGSTGRPRCSWPLPRSRRSVGRQSRIAAEDGPCRATLLGRLQHDLRSNAAPVRARAVRPRRPLGAVPRLFRSDPPGRGAA